ncbi:alpha/beta hydrolase [Paracoccus onubensis]|uniref:alpha/beta hydrolase n=1 Tax=Paracoccus onubensis TaxID=1675788 RepID=UPI0016031D06|nr:alpha/beta hydrolase-fold protein [Paracoccus onubensis]
MIAKSRRSLLASIPTICLAGKLAAQGSTRPDFTEAPEYRIFDAPPDTHILSRQDVTVDGSGYRLFLAVPKATAPADGWPSLWMLDGNAVFDRIGASDLVSQPGLAVIGIGYPVDQIFDTTARALDYTPVSRVPDPEAGRGRATGGADSFRTRLLGPLRDAVEKRVSIDPARRVLWGHSYGGLFTLHCLLSEPHAFAGWAPTSPSSGFGGNVLQHLSAGAPLLEPGKIAPVHIMLGDSEYRRGTEPPAVPQPSPDTMALAKLLEQREDLDVRVTVLKGLGHGQTFAASFPQALDLAANLPGN